MNLHVAYLRGVKRIWSGCRCHFGPCPPCKLPCGAQLPCGHACASQECHDRTPPPVSAFTPPTPPRSELFASVRSLPAIKLTEPAALQVPPSPSPGPCPQIWSGAVNSLLSILLEGILMCCKLWRNRVHSSKASWDVPMSLAPSSLHLPTYTHTVPCPLNSPACHT